MYRSWHSPGNVKEAVQVTIPFLVDTRWDEYHVICLDGWDGLGASAVLRAIALEPPPSLSKKFDKIIHVDSLMWKSRRALQRTIADILKLPPRVMAIFDRKDKEDDFSGVPEGSRETIQDVGREINRALQEHTCLVVFHNGSNNMVDLYDFGIPRPEWVGTKILWTFRGRLRLNPKITKRVDNSHLYLHYDVRDSTLWKVLLSEEAREVAQYTQHKQGITPEIIAECFLYLLSLNYEGENTVDYSWATHASDYWVCDGIIQGGQYDEAWEVADALHRQLRTEDYSSNALPSFGHRLETPPNRWISVTYRSNSEQQQTVPPESTSFFQSGSDAPLPNDMFLHSDKLRVLKLHRCKFSFSSPPFRCCRSLRFLGLDSCKDQQQEEAPKQLQEEEEEEKPEMGFFQRLWVLDICNTDWGNNIAWRQLQILRKLRIIKPTSSWEKGQKDEFADMVKLELLDLSGDRSIQVLPSLSRATGLKTLVLDGCVCLEHVGPEGVPPSLESFSLDAGEGCKISSISLAGCARLVNFKLRGSLPNLKELDISGSAVKTLDLKDEVVHVPSLQQIVLLGCEQLRSILWPERGAQQLRMLCIDTRRGGGEEVRKLSAGSLVRALQKGYCQVYMAVVDIRFIQLLVVPKYWPDIFINLKLSISSTSKDDRRQRCHKEKMSSCSTYTDVTVEETVTHHGHSTAEILAHHGHNSALQFQPFGFCVEIGEGIIYTSVESEQGLKAIARVMNMAKSLHVHDNSCITTAAPECLTTISWDNLRWCRVERCPNLHTVFTTVYGRFNNLETLWAADLPMAHCICSRPAYNWGDNFAKLRSIHLYSCRRLTSVLLVQWADQNRPFPNLETLHIVYCGDLTQVFPVEEELLKEILEFPKLKHIYLHDLPRLHQICQTKVSAPMLETIWVRGCWCLRRLPAVSRRDSRPAVDCEKDWCEKLEWDGLNAGHHPSLFYLRHSQYYKKPLLRGSILR